MSYVVAVCKSEKKGIPKENIGKGFFKEDLGLEGDAHAGFAHRQVSLLAMESIKKMQQKGLDVKPGDFAENITTKGIELHTLPIGTRLKIGSEVVLRISQIGKECHNGCAIFHKVGSCIMPQEGIFAEVLKGGEIKNNDNIQIYPIFKIAVITVSDKGAQGKRKDESGKIIAEKIRFLGDLYDYHIVPDDKEKLKKVLKELVDYKKCDLVFTTGGTGFSSRDITPEATLEIIDKLVPGIPEAMRRESYKITPKAMLSRSMAGIRKQSLIINLPGSPKAVVESLDIILPVLEHGLGILKGIDSECARK